MEIAPQIPVRNSPPSPEHIACIKQRRNKLHESSAAALAGRSEFVWEIGCGHGHFLTAYAAAHPKEFCIGVDVILERIGRAERKHQRAQLANLRFVRADARDFIVSLPPGVRFTAIYMLFPDPWPKRRHHKHRLLEPNFLHDVWERAGQGARFYFRTDHEPYFKDAAAVLATHPDWTVVSEAPWPFEMPTVFQQKAAHFHSIVAERNSH
jgi:tRNA (guanine-N7-)-methyltransferase